MKLAMIPAWLISFVLASRDIDRVLDEARIEQVTQLVRLVFLRDVLGDLRKNINVVQFQNKN